MDNDNFSPLATTYLLNLGSDKEKSAQGATSYLWIGLLALVAVVAILTLLLRKRRTVAAESEDQVPDAEQAHATCPPDSAVSDDLMQRICELMESRKLYLNSELKLTDVAAMLGTNRNTISTCINTQRGCSFSQLLSVYRIDYAKELMRRQPDIKIAEVWTQSGFTNETSLFRTFKALTGLTPNEWKASSGE